MNKDLKCFISSSYGADITFIKNILNDNNVEIFDLYSMDLEFSNSFKKTLKQQIRQVDFVIFVVTDNNPNIFYEIGVCDGIGKKYLVITDKNVNFSLNIQNKLYFQGNINEPNENLLFSLTQFIQKISKTKKPMSAKRTIREDIRVQPISKPVYTGKIDNTQYDIETIDVLHNLEQDIKHIRENCSEKSVSNIIKKLFTSLQFNFVENQDENDLGVDFAIWSEKLGTPIIIELKCGNLSQVSFKGYKEQLEMYAHKSDAKIALLLYLDRSGKRFKIPESASSMLLAYDIEDFIHNLLDESFEDLILTRRNQSAHGHA